MTHPSTYRLMAAIGDFTSAHEQSGQHGDLLKALQELAPQIKDSAQIQEDSPGRQAARAAGVEIDKAAANLAERLKGEPPAKLAAEQPKDFQSAATAAREHLSAARGDAA